MRKEHRARRERGAWKRGVLIFVLALSGTRAVADEDRSGCVAWPGEIDPLPTTADRDPFSARWARLRVAELARLASALEAQEPSEAYRIWRHAACLAPGSAAADRARVLTPGFRVASRPAPRARPAVARTQRAAAEVAASPKPPAERDYGAFDARLEEAEESLRRARFREALDAATALRSELEGWSASEAASRRRVRIEVLGASALVALGEPERAEESFARALELDPELALDPVTTPRKIRNLLEKVRQVSQARQP